MYEKQVGSKIQAQRLWKEQQLILWRSIHNYIIIGDGKLSSTNRRRWRGTINPILSPPLSPARLGVSMAQRQAVSSLERKPRKCGDKAQSQLNAGEQHSRTFVLCMADERCRQGIMRGEMLCCYEGGVQFGSTVWPACEAAAAVIGSTGVTAEVSGWARRRQTGLPQIGWRLSASG